MSNYIKQTNVHLETHVGHHTTTHSKLDDVAKNTSVKHTDQVLATSMGGMSMYPDESGPMMDDDGRLGWVFNKSAVSEKINWYFYGAGNTLTTLQDLKSISCLLSIDTYTNTASKPFLIVYSKATGSGDASWYKSRITYQLSDGQIIIPGEEIQAWSGVKPSKASNRRMVEFNSVSSVGTALDTEEILTIAIHTDSGSDIGTKLLVNQVGYDLYSGDDKIERRLNLRF
jgi:hypothetical protein